MGNRNNTSIWEKLGVMNYVEIDRYAIEHRLAEPGGPVPPVGLEKSE